MLVHAERGYQNRCPNPRCSSRPTICPQVCDFENLYRAFRQARCGKRNRLEVAEFENDLEFELTRLHRELRDCTWQPGCYRQFTLYERKPRRISAAPFADRVVHHALCRVLEPIWERRFIHDSYACRAGKGTHAALDRCTRFLRRYRYVLQCDVMRFFPSVDHAILLDLLGRFVRDEAVLDLCRRIIDSGAHIHPLHDGAWRFPGDDLVDQMRPRGLPIGNQTSQFWANVYLHPLDEFIKRELRCRAYLRYCDDFLLFADDKATLHDWRAAIEDFMVKLRLRIHPHKTSVHPATRGTPFLGFTLYPTHRRLARDNGVRFQRRWKRMAADCRAGRLARAELETRLRAWIAHASHGDTRGLRRALISRCPV